MGLWGTRDTTLAYSWGRSGLGEQLQSLSGAARTARLAGVHCSLQSLVSPGDGGKRLPSLVSPVDSSDHHLRTTQDVLYKLPRALPLGAAVTITANHTGSLTIYLLRGSSFSSTRLLSF